MSKRKGQHGGKQGSGIQGGLAVVRCSLQVPSSAWQEKGLGEQSCSMGRAQHTGSTMPGAAGPPEEVLQYRGEYKDTSPVLHRNSNGIKPKFTCYTVTQSLFFFSQNINGKLLLRCYIICR